MVVRSLQCIAIIDRCACEVMVQACEANITITLEMERSESTVYMMLVLKTPRLKNRGVYLCMNSLQ